MASDLSKLLLQLKVDADHDFPTSVHKVLSNDDLLMEILLRLPILSLRLFKRVCKQWLSLITSPSFTLTRTQIFPVNPPSGLFIRRWSQNSNNYDTNFVSFDPRIPVKRLIDALGILGRIQQSCNGLLLCYKGGNRYVCNPSINMVKMLPPEHFSFNAQINIAFDPTKSPCYKVVHVGSVSYDDHDDCETEDHYSIRIQIYSSETGFWSVLDNKFASKIFIDRYPDGLFIGFSDGIYWNDAIHWLDTFQPFLLTLDIADPVLTRIKTPLNWDRKLHKSHDSLVLLCKDCPRSQHLIIYEMNNGCSIWSVKYDVNLDDMLRPYPTWRMPTGWSCDNMLSIVLGEPDEDSYMVINMSGKILQYNFMLETVSELFDLGKAVSQSGCFEYIASFAHT